MSPDPGNPGADPANPQGWNMYTYVLKSPLELVDTSGMECVWDNGSLSMLKTTPRPAVFLIVRPRA